MGEMEELNEQFGEFLWRWRGSNTEQEEDLGAVALVLDLAKAFERVSLPVAWGWATQCRFPRKKVRVLWSLRAPEASTV